MKKAYKPQLFINTKELTEGKEFEWFINETNKHSITPTTFKGRTLNEMDTPFFQELYQYKNSAVNRFGLNINLKKLLEEVADYNLQELIKTKTPSIATTIKKQDIDSMFQDIQLYKETSSKSLTMAEKIVVEEAIKYLQKQMLKTVLIDVFERDADNKVQIKDDIPQTHTVVLYEQEGKYLVVDPSNAEFSTILVGAHENIRVCFNKKIQLYKPNGETGNTPDKWRDCIDIAAKLAFNLNKNSQNIELETIKDFEYINSNSLKDNISIQEITNNSDIYRKIPDEVKYYSFRVKQSSNLIEQKKTTEALKTFSHLSKKVTKLIDEIGLNYISEALQQKKEDIFKQNYLPENYDEAINNLQSNCSELSKIDEVSLLGSSMKLIDVNFSEE